MAKNLVYKTGEQLKFNVGATAVTSGSPFLVGKIPAVAMADKDSNNNVVGRLVGVFELPINDAVNTVGTAIYITSANALTTTVGSNVLFGYALETKSSGAGNIKILLART